MNERQKRLIEVYEHLRKFYGVHTKSQFAEVLGYGRTSLSSALNGNEDYLTDKLFKTICEAYRNVFNLNYLLTGNGHLLTTEEEVVSDRLSKEVNGPSQIDQSSLINALIAAKDETIAAKNAEIAELREHIATLKASLAEYRRIIDESKIDLSTHPFPMGVAEPNL